MIQYTLLFAGAVSLYNNWLIKTKKNAEPGLCKRVNLL